MNEWFDNKTIAVIGNAVSLFDKDYGQEIDSHDVVIRINRGIEICTRERDFPTHGSKTDLWCFNLYTTMIKFCDSEMKKILSQTYKRMEMNYDPNSKFDNSMPREYILEIAEQFKGVKITTGLRVLHYVSKYNFKSVDVYGFDWKETPTYYVDYKSTADLSHNYPKEKEYCFKHYFNTGKFNLKN